MTLLSSGSKLGRFEIAGVLGEGAMGIVYLAHDPQIERPVALKTLKSEATAGPYGKELESRFLKEAKLAGRLSHPNIVTIYEAGSDRGIAYIAMEYVEGEPLTLWLSRTKGLSLPEGIAVVRQVALALEHAHARGVLHRDIKPGNILMTRDGGVKVADFGIGKLLTASGDLTRTGQMIGSPAYMSPEQVRGDKLDGRSDLFSLGVVLYELLTGVRPFPGDSITTLVYQILHTEPRDPLLVRSDLPASTSEVFVRLLAKAPENRPGDARKFLGLLEKIEEGLSQTDRTIPMAAPSIGENPSAAVTSGPAGPAYLFGAAALILAVAVLVWIGRSTAQREQRFVATPAGPRSAPASASSAAGGPSAPPTAAATLAPLPTAGPSGAADAIVGAPRILGASASPASFARRTLTALARTPFSATPRAAPTALAIASEERMSSRESAVTADSSYRTRRYAKLGVSPDQARVYLDGRYVGIADDWDDRGGGKTLDIGRQGTHRLRLELPGYRPLHLEILVTPAAPEETVDIGDDLKRESKVPYPKIPKLDEGTTGAVAFVNVDPSDAVVSEGGKVLGEAFSFTSESPLKLSGPMVHELVISAAGRRSKTVRILVSSNADSDVAKVKAELKKE